MTCSPARPWIWFGTLVVLVSQTANLSRSFADDAPSASNQKASANVSLHERIDRLIEAACEQRVAAPATDGEFARRLYLDFAGAVPSAAEVKAFLDDPSPYKRSALIDRLLDSPTFARRMQVVFDVMLMERRPEAHGITAADWQEFLHSAFARNLPYNELVAQILAADSLDPKTRGASRFLLDRDGNANTLTRDVGRVFLGRDMQCAQCHDHVLYDDYKQAHYYGLFAFFSRSALVQLPGGAWAYGEKADGNVEFKSVFKKTVTNTTLPRLLDEPPITEPAVEKGAEYWAAPRDNGEAIPRFSRRAQLAPLLSSGKLPDFNRNIANRLWAILMGRGLVHPLDLHHSDNPPSHPELLNLLATEFAAMHYDIKAFLRELALTRTYSRSSEPAPGMADSDLAPERFAVFPLKPLSPEQIGWSLLQVSGILASTRADAERRLLALDPKFGAIAASDAKRARMALERVEADVYDGLKGNMGPFVAQFGRAAGQAQEGGDTTVHQALFISNGEPVNSWMGTLANRVNALTDPNALCDELYLATLSRRPTSDERAEVIGYLAKREKDRAAAVRELAWALVSSTEFRFNH